MIKAVLKTLSNQNSHYRGVKKFYTCRAFWVTKLIGFSLIILNLVLATACEKSIVNTTNAVPSSQPEKFVETAHVVSGGTTGDGGGGQGVICSDEVKDQRLKGKIFVRDIYEAIVNYKRTMKQIEGKSNADEVSAEAIKVLVDSIKFYFGPASRNLYFANENFWLEFIKRISFLSEDFELLPSQDANSAIALPIGCQIVQMAFWDESAGVDNEGTLHVDQKRWRQLDQFNKIALLAHEFFFKQARKSGYKNSDFIRFKVGQLLSTEGLVPLFKQWAPSRQPEISDFLPASKNGFKVCHGASLDDPMAKMQLYQYEGKDKLQHFVIPLLETKTINKSLLQNAYFTFDPKKDEILTAATDLMLIWQTKAMTGPEHLRSHLFNLHFYDSGILSEIPDWDYSIQHEIENLMKKLGKSRKEQVWEGHISTPADSIKIIFLNQGGDIAGGKKTIKSLENLIRTVYYRVDSETRKIAPRYDKSYLDNRIHKAIGLLNREIDDAIHLNKYNEGFSKWKEDLNSLIFPQTRYTMRGESLSAEQTNKINEEVSERYLYSINWLKESAPELLLALKLNKYSEKEVNEILGDDGFDFEREKSANKRASFQISQGNSTSNFQFECNDYPTVFANNTKKQIKLLKEKPIVKIVSFHDKKESLYSFDDKSFERFFNFLKLKNFDDGFSKVTSKLPIDLDDRGELVCREEEWKMGYKCEDLKTFIADYHNSVQINVTPCPSLRFQDLSEGARNVFADARCALLNMGENKDSYRVSFRYKLESIKNIIPVENINENLPEILYIRRIHIE